jgi:hypothetical protein
MKRLILIAFLVTSLEAQQADALKIAAAPAPNTPSNIKHNIPAPVVVEVRDLEGRIVPGARVQLTMPGNPPATRTALAWTDTEGRAYVPDIIPEGQAGKFPIAVQASFNGRLGTATFNNDSPTPAQVEITRTFTVNKPSHKLRNTLIIAGIAGAVALAIILPLTLGGSSAVITTPVTTTVTVGGIGVGGPH